MTTKVQLKEIETGTITEHYSVDAAEMLATERWVQVGGPRVIAAKERAPVAPEPGPPVLHKEPDEPHIKRGHAGKYDVIGADGTKVSTEPLMKSDAEALVEKLKHSGSG